ncbi:hypothetical protein BHE74_00009272 [Ensete ventricosum]|nr:hypothetical protein BHE74_00009272 [Ensete ventricosum]
MCFVGAHDTRSSRVNYLSGGSRGYKSPRRVAKPRGYQPQERRWVGAVISVRAERDRALAAMASLSESRNMTLEDAEVTSEHRGPEPSRRQLIPLDERDAVAARELDLEFPLLRQNTIYSLTLDEIQNAVCEPGKTFGSMNMDEFLTNIWNVEEIQAAAAATNNNKEAPSNHLAESTAGRQAAEAPPLRRQGSLTLPAPLSRKTVDEVWAEIHRDAALRSQHVERASQEGAPRQPTFGEMTLEDFLIKAGVVREGYGGGPPGEPSPHQQPVVPPPAPAAQQYGMAGFGHVVGMAGYVDEQGLGPAAGVGNGGYSVGNGFGGRVGNGYAAAAAAAAATVGSPPSPVSSEGIGGGQVDNTVAGYVADGPRVGGRKRPTDGAAVDKVVERRQRRMIKNRESAARSRARKQVRTYGGRHIMSHKKTTTYIEPEPGM